MRTVDRSRNRLGMTAVVAASVSMLVLAACSKAPEESGSDGDQEGSDVLIVGAAVAESGVAAPFDQPSLNSFKLGIADLNEAGGIDGREVRLIEGDTQSDIAKAPGVAEDLIAQGAEILLVTCDFDLGAPAANVAQREGLVSISLCTGSPKFGVQGVGDKAYTLKASVGTEAAVLATFAKQQGWEEVSVLLDDSLSVTTGLCAGFEKFFPELGGTIVTNERVDQAGANFSTQVSEIASAKPDAVLLCSYPPGGTSVIRALRGAGVDQPILSGNTFNGRFWVEAVPDISDVFVVSSVSTYGDDPNQDVNDFAARYIEEYGEEPTTTQAVIGYAISQVIAEAVETAGSSDGDAVRDALDSLEGFETLNGPITFTSEAHIPLGAPLAILEFSNGEPRYLETVSPEVEVTLTDGVG
jgi:branched-chain amino acid transport system substrate-binding protein